MKKIYLLLSVTILSCFAAYSASDTDSLIKQATGFSNDKKIDKQVAQQLKENRQNTRYKNKH